MRFTNQAFGITTEMLFNFFTTSLSERGGEIQIIPSVQSGKTIRIESTSGRTFDFVLLSVGEEEEVKLNKL